MSEPDPAQLRDEADRYAVYALPEITFQQLETGVRVSGVYPSSQEDQTKTARADEFVTPAKMRESPWNALCVAIDRIEDVLLFPGDPTRRYRDWRARQDEIDRQRTERVYRRPRP